MFNNVDLNNRLYSSCIYQGHSYCLPAIYSLLCASIRGGRFPVSVQVSAPRCKFGCKIYVRLGAYKLSHKITGFSKHVHSIYYIS
jgi:hypothetical protein